MPQPLVQINPADAGARGIAAGEAVVIESKRGLRYRCGPPAVPNSSAERVSEFMHCAPPDATVFSNQGGLS